MHPASRRHWLGGLALLLAGAVPARAGVVVEAVAKGSASERAGLRAGDTIDSWSREARPRPRRGPIASGLDLMAIESEEAPRGALQLAGRSEGRARSWTMPPGTWELKTRPVLPAEAALAEARGHAEARRWAEADPAYDRAATAVAGSHPAAAAQLLREWANSLRRRGQLPQAEAACRRALALDQKAGAESVGALWSRAALGTLARDRGDLQQAEALVRQAQTGARQLLPGGSLVEARALTLLGAIQEARDDYAGASEHYTRGLAIYEALVPGTAFHAEGVANMGRVAFDKNDFAGAAAHFSRAIAIHEARDPRDTVIANLRTNLGNTYAERGDLVAADEQWHRALELWRAAGDEGLPMARVLGNLGSVASMRGDAEGADRYQRQALAIFERLAPDSYEVGVLLSNIAGAARNRGDLDEAEAFARRALAVHEKRSPDTLPHSEALDLLGTIEARRGRHAPAEELLRRALAIQEKLMPQGSSIGSTLHGLGEVARGRGDLQAAREWHARGLAIRQAMNPETIYEAESLHALGLVHRGLGEREPAAQRLCQAVDVVEQQKARLGGSQEARATFASRHAAYYHACAAALLDTRREAEALQVVERSRARLLLSMLAERELELAEAPPPELAQERRRLDADYERLQDTLAGLDPAKAGAEAERARTQLAALREERVRLAARVREASPRFAALHYPQPLDLGGVLGALDAGTALVSYSVGEAETFVFVVQAEAAGRPPLTVAAVPIGEAALREKVAAFLGLVARHRPAEAPELERRARELYDLLLRPAEARLARSARLLISPDGPLHTLPFAALRRADGRALVEWKPLHLAVSATVFAELKKARRAGPGSGLMVAFGDPRYPAGPAPAGADERGFSLAPLPASREEVEGIAALDPARTRAYLGDDATEERAKAVGRDAQYVHFACHGFLDERSPLSSSLALSIPAAPAEGRDNGYLQVWEIFERVRLDADLVTLSACKTALGKESAGEGLLGLTRAFQYAGARSVLASLWSVSDRSTAELMKSFYARLKSGPAVTKDEALRAAQLALLRRGGRLAHPFHWAAFELNGDWR